MERKFLYVTITPDVLTVGPDEARRATLYKEEPRRIRTQSKKKRSRDIYAIDYLWDTEDYIIVDYTDILFPVAVFMVFSSANRAGILVSPANQDDTRSEIIVPIPNFLHKRRITNYAEFRPAIITEAFFGVTTYAAKCRAVVTNISIAPSTSWPDIQHLLPVIAQSPGILPNLTHLTIYYNTPDPAIRDTFVPCFPPTVRNLVIHGDAKYASHPLQHSPSITSLSVYASPSVPLFSTSVKDYVDSDDTTPAINHDFPSLASISLSNIRTRIAFEKYDKLRFVDATSDTVSPTFACTTYVDWLHQSPALRRNSTDVPPFVIDACNQDSDCVNYLRRILPDIAPQLVDALNDNVSSDVADITTLMMQTL